ncbi:MAG: RsmE family RNA methyltransferase [Candidatus Paceibacterota bacterium]
MRLHRFFVAEPIGKQTQVSVRSSELAHQIRRVFRLKKGDAVILFDGSGPDYECEIVEFNEKLVIFHIVSVGRSQFIPSRRIYLCAGIVKKDKFEWIVEKATELGVTDIVPINCERSEKKSLNATRLSKIAIEASEQSGRGNVPTIHPATDPKDLIDNLKKDEVELVAFHTEGREFKHENLPETGSLAIFIGPEGGWSPDELDMFHKNDIAIVCLGPQVLRAETAVVAALSVVTLKY